jgi:hypothetical protein
MSETRAPAPRRGFSWGTLLLAILLTPVLLLLLAAGFVWFILPGMLLSPSKGTPVAPVDPAAIQKRIEAAMAEVKAGREVEVSFSDGEIGGLIAYHMEESPDVKLSSFTITGEQVTVGVMMDASMLPPEIPQRFQGPVELKAGVEPRLVEGGRLQIELTSVKIGSLPIPMQLIRLLLMQAEGELEEAFDPLTMTLEINLDELIQAIYGEKEIHAAEFRIEQGQLILRVAPGRR